MKENPVSRAALFSVFSQLSRLRHLPNNPLESCGTNYCMAWSVKFDFIKVKGICVWVNILIYIYIYLYVSFDWLYKSPVSIRKHSFPCPIRWLKHSEKFESQLEIALKPALALERSHFNFSFSQTFTLKYVFLKYSFCHIAVIYIVFTSQF